MHTTGLLDVVNLIQRTPSNAIIDNQPNRRQRGAFTNAEHYPGLRLDSDDDGRPRIEARAAGLPKLPVNTTRAQVQSSTANVAITDAEPSRKKSRCSGEKPTCSFCARLKQECCYDEGPVCHHTHATPSNANEINLAARVALLESKLSLLDSGNGNDLSFMLGNDGVPSKRRRSSAQQDSVPSDKSPESPDSQADFNRKFTKIPPTPVLRSILKSFFRYCQNQPYVYFSSEYFYRKLDSDELPDLLLMSMAAMASRFSEDPFFEGRQRDAAETYARTAWAEIFEKSFSDDYVLDVHTVQATNMLAMVDFTGSRQKLAWVKIGLAVRFAQSLQLNKEPPTQMPPDQQDERRRTFWSVYLLDRLVSCGTNRPPTLADSDCTVLLPALKSTYYDKDSLPDLRALSDMSWIGSAESPECFAQTILMASALGRVERHTLQYQSGNNDFPPWDSRSEFAAIYSTLLNFEAHSDVTKVSFSTTIRRYIKPDGTVDHQNAGHFVFSNILYHLNQCLLHHPFLLRRRLEPQKSRISPSFLREALRRSREHAYQLTVSLRIVQRHGLTMSSFYAYATMVAGSIHKLFIHHCDEWLRKSAQQLLDYSLDFLDKGQGTWDHYPRVATALRTFSPDSASARALVTINSSPISDPSLDIMWSLLDYGWLSDHARPSTVPEPDPDTTTQPSAGDGSLDIGLMGQAYDFVGDYDVDAGMPMHEQMSLDYLAFSDNAADTWPGEEGEGIYSGELILPSPWTPHFNE